MEPGQKRMNKREGRDNWGRRHVDPLMRELAWACRGDRSGRGGFVERCGEKVKEPLAV